jgi:hypothetical protein
MPQYPTCAAHAGIHRASIAVSYFAALIQCGRARGATGSPSSGIVTIPGSVNERTAGISVAGDGLPVQCATHGIVQGHRSTFVPGLIERLVRQYRADRLHLAFVDELLVRRPCATHLLLQRIGCAPQSGSARWRRRRRSDAGKPFQRLDDTRAIAQAVQDSDGLGEMRQREVATPLVAFCQPNFSKGGSYFPRRSELARYHK